MSAVIKVRSETTEVTKAELSEATEETVGGWCLVGLETFPVFFRP